MALTLERLNTAPEGEAAALLDGIYEHSPWIAQAALARRPFASLAQLKHAMAVAVREGGAARQLALIRAHPELAGKAMVAKTLTAESTGEQSQAGLTHCTPEEFARLQELNAAYNAKFGFPFILAVRGPRGTGLTRAQIIAAFERRLDNPPDFEQAEALRNVHRIAEIRLNDRFGAEPVLGNLLWDWHEDLARFSDPGFAEKGQLTVTYLTDAHRAAAATIEARMREAGFDEVKVDAVGNVVGRYFPARAELASPVGAELASPVRPELAFPVRPELVEGPASTSSARTEASSARTEKWLLTGSHYDTVRNAGRYDGRLGIFTPMACVHALSRRGERLPFGVEVVAFAEEEGQRYKAIFLGSSALTGHFDPAWLEQRDASGVSMRDAMRQAGLPATMEAIAALRRDPRDYLGFVEVHIEQGPVLNEMDLPLGIVTSINGSVRSNCEVTGMASHAGTTPMDRRRDAAAAVAELVLHVEQRAAQDRDSVGTVGILSVPAGSINVVPGRCQFTLDLRAPTDAQRDALVNDVMAGLQAICARRGVRHSAEETMRAAAAPSDAAWQQRWERAVASLGVPLHRMPSGAGHDAMKLHLVMPQAMLFVRGENAGISHNPLESTTSDDMQLAADAFLALLRQLAQEQQA
jgi:N-carbamoyl-L-amino-acid hydrolase